MKTFDRLDYCPYIQTITFIFSKSAPTFSGRVSVSKICTSGDLHHTIRGPASHHPRTCITPFEDLHHTIRRPASHHLRTCITSSEDLLHIIRGPASHHPRTCSRSFRGTCMLLRQDSWRTRLITLRARSSPKKTEIQYK